MVREKAPGGPIAAPFDLPAMTACGRRGDTPRRPRAFVNTRLDAAGANCVKGVGGASGRLPRRSFRPTFTRTYVRVTLSAPAASSTLVSGALHAERRSHLRRQTRASRRGRRRPARLLRPAAAGRSAAPAPPGPAPAARAPTARPSRSPSAGTSGRGARSPSSGAAAATGRARPRDVGPRDGLVEGRGPRQPLVLAGARRRPRRRPALRPPRQVVGARAGARMRPAIRRPATVVGSTSTTMNAIEREEDRDDGPEERGCTPSSPPATR